MIKKNFTRITWLFGNSIEKGGLLLIATLAALLIANSPYLHEYNNLLNQHFGILWTGNSFSLSLKDWINDFLMTFFFLIVSIEIKREMYEGNLVSWEQRILPLICAIFGVILPILIYLLFNYNNSFKLKGWAIPSATDIAFALGILSIFGKNIPTSLKVFLATLAVIDDLIAIIIISLFYANSIDIQFLIMICLICLITIFINRYKLLDESIYITIGVALWYCCLKSGIHATISGVILGFLIPLYNKANPQLSPSRTIEKKLHKSVMYYILPLFAFTNSALNFGELTIINFRDSVTLGIILGLFIGKQSGVYLSGWLLIKYKFCKIPNGANLLQFYGVSILCGIGFTMSLFIGMLAFESTPQYIKLLQLGVMIGSFICSIYGIIILKIARR